MPQWPPSPIVEDEATSLAKEHRLNNLTLKPTDEQHIPSRGSPDQMPVIVDSDVEASAPLSRPSGRTKDTLMSEKEKLSNSSSAFQTDTRLPTPPPSDTEMRGRSHHADVKKDKDETVPVPRSKSATGRMTSGQSRPSISRIQTDVTGELERMKAGTRRAPSPYSYTRETGTFKVDPVKRYSADTLLSPLHAAESPASISTTSTPRDSSTKLRDYDSSTDGERKPKKSIRFAEKHQGPAHPQQTESLPSVTDTRSTERRARSRQRLDSYHSDLRKCQKSFTDDEPSNSGGDVPAKTQRSRSQQPRASSKSRESPSSLSADDANGHKEVRSTTKSGSDEHAVRQRSSHRRERPRFEEPLSHQIFTHSKSGSIDDDAAKRVYRVRDGRNPMTPPSVTTPNHLDDYFSQAFQDNALKGSRFTHRTSVDESAVFSPPSSPPRTPRSERPGRQEYFASPSSSPHRTPYGSRPPSFDESQLKDPKAYSSLLSQATSTAAVLATKTSPPVSRSASNALETTFACSSNALPSKPRSRASSPQRERFHRSDTFTYGDQAMPRPTSQLISSKRPSTRDGLPKIEIPVTASYASPQRNASWTSHDPQYSVHANQFGGAPHTTTTMSTVMPATQLKVAPQIHRSHSASTPQELSQGQKDFILPACPRSQPSQGLRDWLTIKDMSDLDICPKCAHVLSFTRYRTLLARSPDKPYDKSTVCALSRPWIRVALIQSVKLNKPDLTMVRKASVLPTGARPCEGSRSDVRTWWKLIDPATDRAVPDFFACSACIGSIHQIFPDLPDQFRRDVLNQEKVCSLQQSSKHFNTMVEQLDQISEKCRDRGKSSARYMQPFVDHVRRATRHPECARETLLSNRAWHFTNDLPEFTICEACYEEVVWPQREKPIARDISKTTKIVPQSAFKGFGGSKPSNDSLGTYPTSCQLYSDRMRRLFTDTISGRLSYENFKAKAKERQAAQYRLLEMNKMYEEDQRLGWDRRADIDKNKLYWKRLE